MQKKSKAIAVSNTTFQLRNVILLSTGLFIAALTILASTQVNAQNKTKPKLVPIILNEKTNNPKALAIVKKLDPDFFTLDKQYMRGSPDAKFFARFIPLDKTKQKRFVVATTTDNFEYCTSYGCPFYFYENTKENQWRLVLSWQANNSWFDSASNITKPANIITQTMQSAKNKVNVWMWSVNKYIEVTKR